MHGKHLQSLSLFKGYIWDLLPPPCWDLWLLGSIEPCLYRLGLICASFCGTTKFWVPQPSLARLLFHGLLMQAWLYSIVESTFGLLILVPSATVLCIRTYRWSRGHIPIRVFSNMEYSVGCLPDRLYEIWWYRRIFVSPQHSAELIWLRVLVRWWCLLIVRRWVSANIRNRPIILSDHHS